MLIPKREWIRRLAVGQNGGENMRSGTNSQENDSVSTLLHSFSSASNPRRLRACQNELHTVELSHSTNDLAPVICRRSRRKKYLSPSRGLTIYIPPMIVSSETSQLYIEGPAAPADDDLAPLVPLLRNLARGFHNLSLRTQVTKCGNSSSSISSSLGLYIVLDDCFQ